MAAKNETIFPLLLNAPWQAGAPLFPFTFPIARRSTFQFLSPRTAPQLKTHSAFRQLRYDNPIFSSKSPFRKRGFRGILGIRRTPCRKGGLIKDAGENEDPGNSSSLYPVFLRASLEGFPAGNRPGTDIDELPPADPLGSDFTSAIMRSLERVNNHYRNMFA